MTAKLTRAVGVLRSLAWTQGLSFFVLVLLLMWHRAPLPPAYFWPVALGMGVAHTIGTLFLYRAFAVGKLAVVAPVAAAYVFMTSALSIVLSGEKLSISIVLGALLLLGGVGLITRQKESGGSLKGVPEALIGSLCFGLVFWALDEIAPKVGKGADGYLWPLLMLRAFAVCGSYALMFGASKRWGKKAGEAAPLQAFQEPPFQPRAEVSGTFKLRESRPLVYAVALGDTLAWLALSAGLSGGGQGGTTIVTALSSLSHAVTVLLAWALLSDKLQALQWLGVVVILAGVMLLSI